MDARRFEEERIENIECLNSILEIYKKADRKIKKALEFIVFLCAISMVFMFSSLLGGGWGYIVAMLIIGIGVCCINELGRSFKNDVVSDAKLAFQTCVTMEILVKIEKGTYRENGIHIIGVQEGKHLDLYEQFIQFYPEYKCKELKRLAKIKLTKEDMWGDFC